MRVVLTATIFVAGIIAAHTSAAQTEQGIALRAVRFYRADHHHTRVTVFLQIPSSLVDPTPPGPDGIITYDVSVRVADGDGVALYAQHWRSHVPASARGHRSCAVETIEFLVPPGRFSLDARVQDSVSRRASSARADIEGYAASPSVSDLLMSSDMREAASDDSVPRPGELRRGSTVITATALLHVNPSRAVAHYLLEAYGPSDREQSGTMALQVRDSSGAAVLRTKAVPIYVQRGGSVLRGEASLTGLGPGRYTLIVSLGLGGETVERSAEFVIDASPASIRISPSRNCCW